MFDTKQKNYQYLRNIVSERSRDVLFWVGSGLSTSCGLPSWGGLKDSLCEAMEDKLRTVHDDQKKELSDKLKATRSEENYWTAFEMLRSQLGHTSYRATIKRALAPGDTCEVPLAYKKIWSLRPRGLLTLNLDRLATKAFNLVRPGMSLNEFSGREAGRFSHLLKSPNPFLANLHGITADESSWAFTRSDLAYLLNDNAYRQFLSACILGSTIVFIGISADDLAVRGHIETLNSFGVNTGEHYWITSRADLETDRWAEKSGILVVRYEVFPNNDHSQSIDLLDDLHSFVSKDEMPSPVIPSVANTPADGGLVPDVATLRAMPNEYIRKHLNSGAASILNSGKSEKYDLYDQYCKKYASAIHQAWFIAIEPPDNILLGYELQDELAKGAFGTVYRAKSLSRKS